MRDVADVIKELSRLRGIVEQELRFFVSVDDEFVQWYTDRFSKITSELKFPDKKKAVYIKKVKVASGYQRIIHGGHGPYLEFSEKDLCFTPAMKKGQEWRKERKYDKCKYLWLTHPELDIKIYKQKHKVRYADYKPGMYYIDALLLDGLLPVGETSPVTGKEDDIMDLL